jgi:rubredoxin
MVRESDARIPAERRARRTLQEMLPGYERQPVLILHRPVMADDACPLCLRWNCDPSNCPPAASAPAPAAADGGMQCDVCGGVFGAAPLPSAGMQAVAPVPTAWTCSACQNNGY